MCRATALRLRSVRAAVSETNYGPRLVLALGAASAFCLGLLALHSSLRGALEFNGLAKNLALAWIPLLLSLLLPVASRVGQSRLQVAAIGALWLLFLPNAPYIVTDVVHISSAGGGATLADSGLVAAFALTGLALGFASVLVVHGVVHRLAGRSAGWFCVLAAIGLSGVGVYLGRVHRFNSWDALADPLAPVAVLSEGLVDPLAHGRFYAALAAYTLASALVYAVLHRSRRSLVA